ncbi:MAG: class I SAM-dependent methyltransferase [Anaerolineae bacterium]|nr:class I SAM-dependent methyltransferase [Anaerolineae bacterium]
MLTLLEEDRHWWFASRTRAILAYLDRYVGPGRGCRILDIGCGAANMTHHLRHYGEVIGVDSNPKPLEVARQRGLEAYLGSADDLPFEDASFDLVALLDTLEHIPAEEQALAECRRVLRGPAAGRGRAGGKLLITVPAFMFLWSRNDELNLHRRRYTAPELRAKLERHGFRVLRISYNNFFIFPVAAALILLRRGRAEPKLASPHFDEDAYQVEMEPASPLVNALLTQVGKLEAALLRHVALPLSLIHI